MNGVKSALAYAAAIALSALSALACPAPARAQTEVTKTQVLIENAEEYDGKQVAIEGEAVGDVMRRGEIAWITVNDDAYAEKGPEEGGRLVGMSNSGMGVKLPAVEAEKISVLGSYKHKGDRVRVTGIFRRVDRESGGDMVIQGISLEVIEPGYPIEHPVKAWKAASAVALAVVVLVLAAVWLRRSRVS